MSFTSEFEQLYKEKKERDAQKAQSMIGLFNTYSQELAAKQTATREPTGIEILEAGALSAWGDGKVGVDDFTAIPAVILGTAGDIATGVGKGFFNFAEGIADTIGYGIYGARRLFGETEADLAGYKRDIAASTADKIFGGADEYLDQYSALGRTSRGFAEGVGQLIPLIAGGQVLGSLGSTLLLGGSSFGSGMSEAYMSGATDGEALAYGAISATTEVLTEKLFGGLGKGFNAAGFNKGVLPLDDMTAKAVSKLFKSQSGKNVAEYVVKMGFEGLEEAIAGYVSAHAKKGTFKSEEDFAKILKDENLFEQFLIGAMVSGVAQAGDVRIANKTGTDLVTGLTRNEQAVIDKEVENRIAQEEKGGKKLSGKEKSEIYDWVVKDMERGYISTETIESVLGKDALTQYDALSQEAQEFKTLYETEGGKLSEKQKDRLAELKEKNKANPYEQLLKSQRAKISKDVSALAQSDRLGESYREQTRKGEKFQADVSKYSEAQRKTVQNAIDSGILNNTNRSHEFVDLVAKISADKGISFDFADNTKLKESGFALDGVLVNGFVNEDGVTINVQSAKALNRVVGHEITHVLEGTELYNALQSAVTEYAKGKKEYDSRLKELTELYKGKNANVEQELVADLVGDYLFTDADFIKHLSTEHRNLAQKIYDEIKYLCKVVTAGTKEARQLEKVKKAFADAYRAETKNPTADGGVKYSINSKFYEQLDNWDGKTIGFSFVIGETSQALQEAGIPQKQIRWDASKISTLLAKHSGMTIETVREIPELLENPVIVVDSKKGSNAKIVMGDLRDANGKVVTAVLLLTPTSKKGNVLDLVKISSAEGRSHIKSLFTNEDGTAVPIRYVDKKRIQSWLNVNGLQLPLHNLDSDSNNIISVQTEKSNTKFSLTNTASAKAAENANQKYLDAVSRGDMQAAQQMVDDAAKAAGYTIKAYHGTSNEFTTFEHGNKRTRGRLNFGDGFYFSPDRSMAENYTNTGRVIEGYLKLENPYTVYGTQFDQSDLTRISEIAQQEATYDNVIDVLRKMKYDGIIARSYNGSTNPVNQYVIFDSEQVKSADPVTYDDKGNVIPLSERFNAESKDIRYSLSKKDFSIAPPAAADVYGKDIGYDIAPPIPESVPRVNKARPKVGDPAYAPIAEEYVKQANTDDRMQDVAAIVGDKNTFLSKKAMELYQELSGLSKGVRASKRLGYILDHGYDWKSIKTALLNIRDNPGQVVNANSAAESVAREMLGREYDELVQELSEQNETTDTYVTKMRNIQRELTNNEKLRAEARADYDGEIEKLQTAYDGKKNKTTKAANNLLRRIERLSRMRDNVDADYAKRIGDLEERLAKIDAPEYRRAVQRKSKQAEYTSLMEELVGDTTTWVDKKMGLSYKVNTLRRNLRDVIRDASGKRDIARADAIYDELQGKYNHNEAELKRESRRIKSVFAELHLNHAEDTYAHMLGEFQYNPQSKLTEEVVKEFYEKNEGKIDTDKVDTAIAEARKTFDELIVRVNERLKEQGMKEIPYRKGYFPHFNQPKQGLIARLLNWKTVDTEIPTSIAGLTETFNPERSWQSFNKERKTDNTDYSLAQGLDTYIHGALDWIYHIEDIQKRRALENYIRYIHSDEGIKAKIDEIHDNDEYDADQMQQEIDKVFAEANNPLNNFVTNLRAGTNTLANKKSEDDRKWESNFNRKAYSVMTNLNNRINANMVVGSLSSALTNFIPITQSWVEVSPVYSLKGMRDTIQSTIRDDGVVNKSDFLTNRLLNEESLYKTGWDKISDKAAFMMEAIDNFTSQTVWRSKYLQNIAEGMSETQAIKNADQFAENVIAGRSRGNQPTIFDAKNPFTKIFTAFQLEVSNQYGYMFKDAPQDAATKGRLIKGYATAFLGAYVYNALYSSLVGRDAAFDPISIFEDLFRDMGLFGDDEEEEPEDILLNLTDNILEEVPFVGGLMGGGRIPISSAIPYSGENAGLKGFLTDVSKGNDESFVKEMLKPLYYLVLPLGGGQIKKTNEGLGMFSEKDLITGEKRPITGSYTDSGNLRFPVEDTFGNRLQAGIFGQYASANARDYFDNGRSPLKEKQIHAYMCTDMSIQEYWAYREGLSAIEADKDADGKAISGSKKEKVIKYIEDLDISDDAKHILLKYEYPSDDTYNFEIIDYLNSRTDISYTEIKAILEELGFKVDTKGNITWD